MRLTRRHFCATAALVTLALPRAAAGRTMVTEAKLAVRGAAVRLTLALSGAQPWVVRAAANPPRLLLHLPGALWQRPAAQQGMGVVRSLRWMAASEMLRIELSGPALAAAEGGRPGALVLLIRPAPAALFAAAQRAAEPLAQGRVEAPALRPLVVLDPGHGGRDPGAIGRLGTQEKHLTLAIALAVRRRLEATRLVRVRLTRSRDRFVPLADRVALARRHRAALFVSLHADWAPGARGASVYTLAETASDELSEALAERENSADRAGGLRLPSLDPEVERILAALMRQETQAESRHLARLMVRELAAVAPLLPQPQRQARFLVLQAPDIPSVLIELGFLSDPRDEAALRQAAYRERLAAALARGIIAWVRERRWSEG